MSCSVLYRRVCLYTHTVGLMDCNNMQNLELSILRSTFMHIDYVIGWWGGGVGLEDRLGGVGCRGLTGSSKTRWGYDYNLIIG